MLFKTSWHQEHIDRWTREFGNEAKILCRIVLLNIGSRSANSRDEENTGFNTMGRCLVDTKCRKSQEVWVFVKIEGGLVLVNEETGNWLVAQGHRGSVACTHDSIDTRALWELDFDAGHMMFRNVRYNDCSLDLSNESGFCGAPVYIWGEQTTEKEQWSVTETAVISV